jgi:hypothetical protein
VEAEIPSEYNKFTQEKMPAYLSVSHKLSARDNVTAGAIVDLLRYGYAGTQLSP